MKMTPIEAVHTFARRHCIERLAAIEQNKRLALSNGELTQTYCARGAVLRAILIEVERLTPDDFTSRSHAGLRLAETGQTASIQRQIIPPKTPAALEAIQEERDLFSDAVREFASDKDWKRWDAAPLPYRRTLRHDETKERMAAVREKWGITGRWWLPFEHYDLPYEAVVLDSQAVRELLGFTTLRRVFEHKGIERMYELWEHAFFPNRQIETSLWNPDDDVQLERYWFDDKMDWLYYTTHENSTAIAGEWLLGEIKAAWPEWEAYQWLAPWTKEEIESETPG